MINNENSSSSFTDLINALRNNIMRNTNVADLVQVIQINDGTYKVQSITNTEVIIDCISLSGLTFQVNDIALILFTKNDFKTNLTKIKNGQTIATTDNKIMHSKAYGILIGLVYRKETENASK